MRIVDLSVALKAGIASDPPSMLPKIEYLDHKQGAQDFAMNNRRLMMDAIVQAVGSARGMIACASARNCCFNLSVKLGRSSVLGSGLCSGQGLTPPPAIIGPGRVPSPGCFAARAG